MYLRSGRVDRANNRRDPPDSRQKENKKKKKKRGRNLLWANVQCRSRQLLSRVQNRVFSDHQQTTSYEYRLWRLLRGGEGPGAKDPRKRQ